MKAELSVLTPKVATAADLRLQVTLTNPTAAPLRVDTWDIAVPALSLQVRNAAGESVPRMPPPVPAPSTGKARRVIEPGATHTFEFKGSSLFGTTLPKGSYEVRYHAVAAAFDAGDFAGTLDSDWVKFEIGQ